MPEGVIERQGQGVNAAPAADEGMSGLLTMISRMMIFYFVYKQFTSTPPPASNEVLIKNYWTKDDVFNCLIYLSPDDYDDKFLIFNETNIKFEDQRFQEIQIPTNDHIINNGSIYAHIYVFKGNFV